MEGATENARLEISAPSKMQEWKMQDWKNRHQTGGVENTGPSSYGKPKHLRDWKLLCRCHWRLCYKSESQCLELIFLDLPSHIVGSPTLSTVNLICFDKFIQCYGLQYVKQNTHRPILVMSHIMVIRVRQRGQLRAYELPLLPVPHTTHRSADGRKGPVCHIFICYSP